MLKFVLFLKKIYLFLLFIVLEVVAINFYANSTNYTRAKLLTASNTVVGGIYKAFSDMIDYFGLRSENDLLLDELAAARGEIEYLRSLTSEFSEGSLPDGEAGRYSFTTTAVINNSLTRQENYVMLDKGSRDGVEVNMAVVTPEGSIVGYILDRSERFSVAISVLNINFKTGGKLKDKENFGSVYWDGRNHNYLMLSEIPKYTDISPGDTVVTSFSSIFPPEVTIGTVEDFELNQSSYYDVRVKLATDMSALKKVFIVRYADIVERMLLEEAEY